MFCIVNETKSFMKPECSVIQSPAIYIPYKWAAADALFRKKFPWYTYKDL